MKEKEQKRKPLPEAVTPQLDTELAAFRLSSLRSEQTCGYSSRRNQKLACTVRILHRAREPLLNVLSLWCLNKGSAWETRSQGCIISFLGLGQETRKSPEGTLIRSRKQHKELSFSPTGKGTKPSETSNLIRSLDTPSQTHAHLQSRHNALAGSSTLSEPASIFLSVSPSPTRQTWLRTHVLHKAS